MSAGPPPAGAVNDTMVNPVFPYAAPTGDPHSMRADPLADAVNNPLVGSATPNETYLVNRLAYSDVFTDFDPLTNGPFLKALAARFGGVVMAWFAGFCLLFLIFGIAGIAQATSSVVDVYGNSAGANTTLLGIFFWTTVAWSLLLACLFWLTKLSTQVSEWMLTVDDKAPASRRALEHMYAIFVARRTPITSLHPVRIAPHGQPTREYLQVEDGIYLGFISCFAYGSDLFIGWTMSLNLSPFRWIVLHVQRMLSVRTGGPYSRLAYDQPKALREVLHSVVRQGVDVATDEIDAAGQGVLSSTALPTVVI
jgi:hypothetical protein